MADPPFEVDVAKVRVASPLPPTAVGVPGVLGVVAGVDETTIPKLPCPIAFTAATSKLYPVPFTSPGTVAEVEVEAACVKMDQVEVVVGWY
jgi:hypothetical protein